MALPTAATHCRAGIHSSPAGGVVARLRSFQTGGTMGHSVDLVTMKFDELARKEQLQQLEINRIPCWRTSANVCNPLQMFIYLMRALPLALRLARKNKYTINHTHFIFPDGVLALPLKKITAKLCAYRARFGCPRLQPGSIYLPAHPATTIVEGGCKKCEYSNMPKRLS